MVALIYWQDPQLKLGNQTLVHQAPRKTPLVQRKLILRTSINQIVSLVQQRICGMINADIVACVIIINGLRTPSFFSFNPFCSYNPHT